MQQNAAIQFVDVHSWHPMVSVVDTLNITGSELYAVRNMEKLNGGEFFVISAFS